MKLATTTASGSNRWRPLATAAQRTMKVRPGRIGKCPVQGLASNPGARHAKARHAAVTSPMSGPRFVRATIQTSVATAMTLMATATA